jgi:hypothetical protein
VRKAPLSQSSPARACRALPMKAIVRRLRVGRNTVRRWLRGAAPEPYRPRRIMLEPQLEVLERRRAEVRRRNATDRDVGGKSAEVKAVLRHALSCRAHQWHSPTQVTG